MRHYEGECNAQMEFSPLANLVVSKSFCHISNNCQSQPLSTVLHRKLWRQLRLNKEVSLKFSLICIVK